MKNKRNLSMVLGILLTSILAIFFLLGSFFGTQDPFYINMANRLSTSSTDHWLGTDHMGRDIFARIVYGAKLTIGLGLLIILLAMCIGIPIGLLSGYIGGKMDAFFMRVIDGILAFPDLILAIAIAGILGPSLTNIVIAIVLVKWIVYARVVRGLVLEEKQKEFVLASRLSYSSTFNTIRLHIIPQIFSEIVVMAAIDVGKIILLISSFSYIGIGAQAPLPEWGAMLNEGRTFFQVHPSLMVYPGIAILLTVLCCNLLGDGLKGYFKAGKRRNLL
ncbi:nickel transporter permease [Robertmurraya sp. P23]|uniref:nickel transporter permease n=1 Tax=Robertmurraya sp. P23 TaxID=3436931 RepID=UPI003D99512B